MYDEYDMFNDASAVYVRYIAVRMRYDTSLCVLKRNITSTEKRRPFGPTAFVENNVSQKGLSSLTLTGYKTLKGVEDEENTKERSRATITRRGE